MKIKINKATITGFKGYKDTVEYDFSDFTIIKGGNGLGKSSIGEAISWCITGCDMSGNEKATTKLINDNKPKLTEIILDLELDKEPHTIIRRKKGSTNDIYLDDKKITQNKLSEMFYQDKNIFLSIFNPYYFNSLTPKEAKLLLSDVLKPVSKSEIFKELGEYLVKILNDNGFRNPETFLSDTRDNIKEQEKNLDYLAGKMDNYKPLEVEEKVIFDDSELDDLRNKLNELQNNMPSLEDELNKLSKPEDIDLSALNQKEIEIANKYKDFKLKELLPVLEKKTQKNMLLQQYKEFKSKYDKMEDKIIKCSSCGAEVNLTKESKDSIKKDMDLIVAKGKDLAQEIENIEKQNKAIQENNDKLCRENNITLESELNAIKEEKEKIVDKNKIALEEYERHKQVIKEGFISKQVTLMEEINSIKDKISSLESDQRQAFKKNAEIDTVININKEKAEEQEKAKEEVENTKNKINQLKLALDAGKQYNSIKLKKQAAQIQEHLNRVTIQFEKLNKDGELKDDFKILFDGREVSRVSASQQVLASLEIAKLLMEVQEVQFPIFLDDGERINDIPKLNTQMIVAKVTNDKEIIIESEEI